MFSRRLFKGILGNSECINNDKLIMSDTEMETLLILLFFFHVKLLRTSWHVKPATKQQINVVCNVI